MRNSRSERDAMNSGCAAIVVTVDSPVFGRRARDLRNGFTDLPEGMHCANLRANDREPHRPILFDATLDWTAIDWLRGVTALPIVLKGITHPDDAVHDVSHASRNEHGRDVSRPYMVGQRVRWKVDVSA